MDINYAAGALFIASMCYMGFAITLSLTMDRDKK